MTIIPGQLGNQSIENQKESKEMGFVEKVRDAYRKLPEEPKTIPEKVGGFVKASGTALMEEFEQGNILKKIAIIGGIAGIGYLTYKGIKKLGSWLSGGFKKLFGIGEKLGKDLEETKSSTIFDILKIALGGTLGLATISTLYEAIQGKISFVEIMEAWQKDGVKGIGLLLLKKQKDGVISMGKDTWNALATSLGLPAFDKISEGLNVVKEEVEEGFKWLDEKCHFGEIKIRMETFFKDHNITMPDWMKHLSLAEMATDMGIDKNDLKNDNLKTFAEFTGIAGGAILIYKWTKLHGLKKGIVLNAGVYLAIVNETTGEFGRSILKAMGNELDQAKKKLFEKWGGNSQIAAYLEDMFGDFSIEKHFDSSLEWIKEHPAESMLAMNGTWLLRGIIIKGLKKGASASWDAVKFAANNPGKALLVGAGAAALYIGRREFITDFINLTYDDPKGKEAKEMQANLDSIFGVDRSQAETVAEKQVHGIMQSILEDPLKALNLKEVQEAYEKGVFAFGIDIAGKVILLMKGLNLPIQLAGITKESFKSLSAIYAPDYEGNKIAATTIVGAEIIVLGSATYMVSKEGYLATKTIFEMNDKGAKAVGKVLWSFNPLSKEYRFVFKSMASTLFIPAMQNFQGMHIGKLEAEMKKLTALINVATTPEQFKEIQRITRELGDHHMFKDYEKIKESLSGTRFGYEFAKKFGDVKRTIRSIEEAAKKQDATSVTSIRNLIKDVEDKTALYRSGVSRLTERWELLKQAKFSDAFARRTPSEDAELALKEGEKAAYTALDQDELFKTAPDKFKPKSVVEQEAKALREEIAQLDDANPLKKAMQKKLVALESFLNPSHTYSEVVLAEGRIGNIEETAMLLEAEEKGIQARFASEVDEIVKEARRRGISLTDPSVRTQLEELDTKLIAPFSKQKSRVVKILVEEYKKLPASARTKLMKQQIRNVIEGADGTLMTKFVKGAKGRMKMMAFMAGAMFAVDALIHKDDPEREMIEMVNELGPDLGQLLLDVLPVAGTYSNFHSAISGKEIVSGKDVSGLTDRAANTAWGIVGLAADVLTALAAAPSGGADIGVNVFLRLTKEAEGGSLVAIKLLKMWPRFEKLAAKMGGWKTLMEKVINYIGKNKNIIAKAARTTEKVGIATGTVLLTGGIAYHVFHKEVPGSEVEIPEEIMTENSNPKPADENHS